MSSITELNTLRINVLTEAQYRAAVEAGEIEENELYFTTDQLENAEDKEF